MVVIFCTGFNKCDELDSACSTEVEIKPQDQEVMGSWACQV